MSEHQPKDRVVVVAHSDEALRERASELLRGAGFQVVAVMEGQSALALLRAAAPRVLVIGVALREPPFYELCDLIAREELATRVLIVSSVHTAGAYKRAPTNLYGADACVEENRLEDELAAQVEALCQQ